MDWRREGQEMECPKDCGGDGEGIGFVGAGSGICMEVSTLVLRKLRRTVFDT